MGTMMYVKNEFVFFNYFFKMYQCKIPRAQFIYFRDWLGRLVTIRLEAPTKAPEQGITHDMSTHQLTYIYN